MPYTFKTTKDLTVGKDWILQNLDYDDVRFRFIVVFDSEVIKSVWMTPKKSLDYLRYVLKDTYPFKIVMRVTRLPF